MKGDRVALKKETGSRKVAVARAAGE